MRIGEFCAIKRECLKIENGRKYLVVPRNKQKATRKTQVEVIDELEINDDIYELIQEYIELTNPAGATKSLISYPAYKQFIGDDSHNKATQQFTQGNFRRLLDKFYDKIIEQKYQVSEIEKLKPNDTRHFAFCSMMLQGFDALTIARIGGHRSIESQYHYQQHLSYFAQSHVYHLARINKFRNSSNFRSEGSTLFLEQAKINALRPMGSFEHLERMDVGYCTDTKMDCESDYCQLCSKWYIPFEELKREQRTLLDFSESRSVRIEERLKTMDFLRQQIDIGHNEELQRESKLLRGDIEDLAKIIPYIDENGGKNNEQDGKTE
jgi:hypothetical protein